ncbi:MAG TPA: hypothetical protein VGO84_02095 [Burkholderiales bacterium]|nr:hypothetical protein [Burkholderiales bacterium]
MAPLALLLCAAIAYAEPAPALKILATDPAPDALLARQQPFYVRLAVAGPAPVTVTVSGWLNGKPVVDDGGSGAPAQLPAAGTGVVSFFYWSERPTRIDEVRLHLTDAKTGAKLEDYTFPVALTWLSDEPPLREPAAWVKEWQQATGPSHSRTKDNADTPPPATAGWLALAAGVVLLVIAFLWFKRRRTATDGRTNQ